MIDAGLKDRVVLVTGGNHGIGAATARAFAAQGARVFIHYLRLSLETAAGMPEAYQAGRAQSADGVVEAIRASGGRAEAWECDLADPATIPMLFNRAEAACGPVEVLVNNAAHWEADSFAPGGVEDRPLDQWPPRSPNLTSASHDRHFAVNSRAVALMIAEFTHRRAVHGALWGRIVNVSTDGAYCFPGEISYGASKAALEAYTRSAAKELGRYGITVNIVSPGPIQTDWITPELETAIVPAIPLGRLGQPEDVADVIVFLASEQARWLTGQLLHVGGGHAM
jgi:3-oxoacyl-[acyl-carrier protein] reductase